MVLVQSRSPPLLLGSSPALQSDQLVVSQPVTDGHARAPLLDVLVEELDEAAPPVPELLVVDEVAPPLPELLVDEVAPPAPLVVLDVGESLSTRTVEQPDATALAASMSDGQLE